jgi:glycine dehydrogenase
MPREDNPLKNAPHTALAVTASEWAHPYSREQAAFPTAATRARKFWPAVGRINNAQGDRNLVCTCPPIEAYAERSQKPSESPRLRYVPSSSPPLEASKTRAPR